jgi:hypothetical protein
VVAGGATPNKPLMGTGTFAPNPTPLPEASGTRNPPGNCVRLEVLFARALADDPPVVAGTDARPPKGPVNGARWDDDPRVRGAPNRALVGAGSGGGFAVNLNVRSPRGS